MRLAALALGLVLAAPAARAGPGWAQAPDTADDKGHVFTCTGDGKSEDDALAAALGICNDKICQVCGVEVESTVTTNETLKGVDLSRKVVERCRRVRKADPIVKKKSLECDEGRCQAFVQIFYSKDAEKAECPGYARDDFADPAACERDIEAFRQQRGRSAEAFRARTRELDAALASCAKIDVRPTPALLALDEKLKAGLAFARAEDDDGDERLRSHFLPPDGPTLQTYAETKTLLGRIQLLRDLVADRALAMDVLEAAESRALDSEAGMARLLAALKADPPGGRFGAPDAHFVMLWELAKAKADTRALADWFRQTYLPEQPLPTTNAQHWEDISALLAHDDRCSPEEWDWALRLTKGKLCSRCLAFLLRAHDHGSPDVRLQRYFDAVQAVRESFGGRSRRPDYGILQNLPTRDPAFALAVEARAPADWKPRFDFELWGHVTGVFDDKQDPADQARALTRWAETAALPPERGGLCSALRQRLDQLHQHRAPFVPQLGEAVCGCLTGQLANESRDAKSELYQAALDGHLACVEAP